MWLKVGTRKGIKRGRLPQVVHELAEVSEKSVDARANTIIEDVPGRANSSSLVLAGTVLCADSISNSDIRMCNNKFWALQSKSVARKVWETAKSLGVEGTLPDEHYIELIEEGEKRDEATRRKVENNTSVP